METLCAHRNAGSKTGVYSVIISRQRVKVYQVNQQQFLCHYYTILVFPLYIHIPNGKIKAILLAAIQT